MNSIVHLWNISKFFEKSKNPNLLGLRLHYAKCCRDLSFNVELPKQQFGPGAMCPQCGTEWTTMEHKTRISPGKSPSARLAKLIKRLEETNSRLPNQLCTLKRKSQKNRTNKIIRICSVCSNVTALPLNKPKRKKIPKLNLSNTLDATLSSKKKKRKSKDKTAGLNINGSQTPATNRTSNVQTKMHNTLVSCGDKDRPSKLKKASTTLTKSRKLNLTKLKEIVNKNSRPPSKNKLHTFLQELY